MGNSSGIFDISICLFRAKNQPEIRVKPGTSFPEEGVRIYLGSDSGGPGKRRGLLKIDASRGVHVVRVNQEVVSLEEFLVKPDVAANDATPQKHLWPNS
jgi:hypothetical protein